MGNGPCWQPSSRRFCRTSTSGSVASLTGKEGPVPQPRGQRSNRPVPPVSVRPLCLSQCGNSAPAKAPLGRLHQPGSGRKRVVDRNPAVREHSSPTRRRPMPRSAAGLEAPGRQDRLDQFPPEPVEPRRRPGDAGQEGVDDVNSLCEPADANGSSFRRAGARGDHAWMCRMVILAKCWRRCL